jgi:hypothetical protein
MMTPLIQCISQADQRVSTPVGPVGVPYQWARPKSMEESQSACAAPSAGVARASTTTRNWNSSVAALTAAASKSRVYFLTRFHTAMPVPSAAAILVGRSPGFLNGRHTVSVSPFSS